MLDHRDARHRILVAGRELGGGPSPVVDRIIGDAALPQDNPHPDRYMHMAERWGHLYAWVSEYMAPRLWSARNGGYRFGLAVGLVAAEDPDALGVLREINEEWSRGCHG